MEAHYARAKSLISLRRFDDAIKDLMKSQKMAINHESVKYEAKVLYSLAQIQLEQGQPNEAIKYLNSSQALLGTVDVRDQVLDNYLLFIQAYIKLGEYEKVSEYQQKYIELNNEVFSSDLIKNISRIQTEHEERENIKTIAATRQVLALQQDLIQRQRAQNIFIVTITVLVMGLAFVLFWSNRSQRKANQALAVAKETIQQQNELLGNSNKMLESEVADRTKDLINSNEALIKVNAELDNFIYKTSHDIRGPLASLKGICNVALLDVTDQVATDYLKKLDTTASKMNSILSRLLIINQINHSSLNVEAINLKNLVDDILEEEAKKEFPPRLTVQTKIDPKVNLKSDLGMVKIILENLIDNAIKFYTASERVDPFVRISIASVNETVQVSVVDNGIGIHEANQHKIFELFVRASERSESGGIGLYLSRLATSKLGGEINFTKTEEGHTQFTALFPPDLQPILDKRKEEEKRLQAEKEKQKRPEVS
jgi:signal transduction histidine kinase